MLLDYQYNKNGNVSKVTDSLGNITEYTYDTIGRMQKVLDGTTQVAEYSYNIDGTISQINYNNGVNANYAYNRDKNITSLINRNQNGTTISSFAYTYDNNGNQLTKVENEQTTTYTYDQLNRLAQVQYPGNVQESFEYDNAGNRTKKTTGAITTDYAYDQLNRLTQSTENATITTYSYDNNGNQLEKVVDGQTTQYIYDAFNRQTEIKMPDGTWQANKYDAFGMRLAVLENGVRYDFTTDGGNVITETNASGEQVARSIRGIDLVAQEDVKGNLSYYLHNAHGDVVNMVDAAGNVLNSYSYDAFGNTTSYAEKVVNRFLYSGEQLDKLTGDYYLRARYYDPTIGRFTQEDTYRGDIANPRSLNLYSYVMNNPVKYVDPTGHRAEIDGEGSYSAKTLPTKPDTKTSSTSTSTTSTKCDGGTSSNKETPTAIVVTTMTLVPTAKVLKDNPIFKLTIGATIVVAIVDMEIDKVSNAVIGYLISDLSYGDLTEAEVEANRAKNEEKNKTNQKDQRFYGKPGDVNTEGSTETKIGPDGRAETERHNTTHGNSKRHSNPHDHDITWDENGNPIFGKCKNYWDNPAPPL